MRSHIDCVCRAEVRRHMCGPSHYHWTYGRLAKWLSDQLWHTTARFVLAEVRLVKYYSPDLYYEDRVPGCWEGDGADLSVLSWLLDPSNTVVDLNQVGALSWILSFLELYV